MSGRRPTWPDARGGGCDSRDDPSTCCASSRRRCWASVVRRYRDFAACEDAVQEALIAAAAQWPRDGLPDNPRGWLIQVASRRIPIRCAPRPRAATARRWWSA